MVVQSGAPFFQPDELAMVCDRLSGFFAGVRPHLAPVPTYAGGMLALVAAGESRDAVRPLCKVLRERFGLLQEKTHYHTPEVHRAAFTLAASFESSLRSEDPAPAGFLKSRT